MPIKELPDLLFSQLIVSDLRNGLVTLSFNPMDIINDPEITKELMAHYTSAGEREKLMEMINDIVMLNPPLMTTLNREELAKVPQTGVKITVECLEWFLEQEIPLQFEIARRIYFLKRYGVFGKDSEDYKDLSHGLVALQFVEGLRVYVGRVIVNDFYAVMMFKGGHKKQSQEDINYILEHFRH